VLHSSQESAAAQSEVVMLDRHTYQLPVRHAHGVVVEYFSNRAAAMCREQELRTLLAEPAEADDEAAARPWMARLPSLNGMPQRSLRR
jgi:hypothetical protein